VAARRITLRIQPAAPLGDVAVVPAALTGRPEADVARAIALELADVDVPTAAEALEKLSLASPDWAAKL
jgi:hypothetical protein